MHMPLQSKHANYVTEIPKQKLNYSFWLKKKKHFNFPLVFDSRDDQLECVGSLCTQKQYCILNCLVW